MSESQTIWSKWIAISMKASGFLLLILLFACYFTVVLPLAVLFRIFSDPLKLSPAQSRPGSFFTARKTLTETRESAARPY